MNMVILVEIISAIIQNFLIACFFNSLLECKISFSKFLAIYSVIMTILFIIVRMNGNYFILRIGFLSVMLLLLSQIFFKGKFSSKLFVFLIYLLIGLFSEFLTTILVMLTFKSVLDDVTAVLFSEILVYAIFFIIFVPLLYYVSLLLKKNRQSFQSISLLLFIIFPFGQIVFILCLGSAYDVMRTGPYLLFTVIGSMIAFVSDLILFNSLNYIIEHTNAEKHLLVLQKKQESDFENYRQLDTIFQQDKKFKHEINNQLTTIYGLLDRNSHEEAKEILDSVTKDIYKSERRYSDNVIIDVILSSKLKSAEEKGIKVDLDTQLPDSIKISGSDICSVFSNLIDNAIESCSNIPLERNPYINIKSGITKGYLFLKVMNSATNEKKQHKESLLPTSKRDKLWHGVGLQLMTEIAQKYNGTFTFDIGDNEFTSVIFLQLT